MTNPTKECNAWWAKQVGFKRALSLIKYERKEDEFNIADERYLTLVEEHAGISTEYDELGTFTATNIKFLADGETVTDLIGQSHKPKLARLACAIAIWEAGIS